MFKITKKVYKLKESVYKIEFRLVTPWFQKVVRVEEFEWIEGSRGYLCVPDTYLGFFMNLPKGKRFYYGAWKDSKGREVNHDCLEEIHKTYGEIRKVDPRVTMARLQEEGAARREASHGQNNDTSNYPDW